MTKRIFCQLHVFYLETWNNNGRNSLRPVHSSGLYLLQEKKLSSNKLKQWGDLLATIVERLGVGLASGLSGSRSLNDVIGALSFSLSLRLSLLGGHDETGQHEAHLWPAQQAQQKEHLPPRFRQEVPGRTVIGPAPGVREMGPPWLAAPQNHGERGRGSWKETWEKPTKINDSLLLFLPQPPCKVLTSVYAHQVGLGKFLKNNKKQKYLNHFVPWQASLRDHKPLWAGGADLGVSSCGVLPHLPMPNTQLALSINSKNVCLMFPEPSKPPPVAAPLPPRLPHVCPTEPSRLHQFSGSKCPRQKPEYNCFGILPGSVSKLHVRGRANLM